MGIAQNAARGARAAGGVPAAGEAVAAEGLAPLAAALAHVAEAAWGGSLGPGSAVVEPGVAPPVPAEAALAAVAVSRGGSAAGWVRAAAAETGGQPGVDDAALFAWLEGVGDALGGMFGEPVEVRPTAAPDNPDALGARALCFSYSFGRRSGTAWLWLEPGLLQDCMDAITTPAAAAPGAAPPAPDPFPPLGEGRGPQGEVGIDLLLDVPLDVSVELGRTQRPIREILALVPGSVIELDRLAGDPIDVLVNGRRIARAEVVVVDERFAIRITDILTPEERVARLG